VEKKNKAEVQGIICNCGKEKAWDEPVCPECKETSKTVQVRQENAVTTPSGMIQVALENGADLEKLKKLLTLQERWEKNEARKAFVKGMTGFKENPPNVYKDKKNTQFNSMYTSLSNLVNTTIPELSKHGFSHNWQYGTAENGNPSVTCVLTHRLGHSISVTQDAAPIQSKNKGGQVVTNSIQQVKCTQTYLKITTFEAVTGLVSKEANFDDDGNSAGVEYIDEKQVSNILDCLNEMESSEAKFLTYLGVEKLELLPKSQYQKAINALNATKAKKEGAK